MHEVILDRLIAYCVPYALPDIWRRFPSQLECYRCPDPAERVLTALAWEFSSDELVDAGIAFRGPELTISMALADPSDLFVALRPTSTESPDALLTIAGVLGNSRSPSLDSFALLADQDTGVDAVEPVLAVLAIEDLVALWSVEIHAVLAHDLSECDADQLGQLCSRWGWLPSANQDDLPPQSYEPLEVTNPEESLDAATGNGTPGGRDTEQDGESLSLPWGEDFRSVELFFVDGSPAALDVRASPKLPPTIEFLACVERHLELDLSVVGVWSPSPTALDSLRFLLRVGDAQQVRTCLMDNVRDSAFSLDGYLVARSRREELQNYATVLGRLHRLFVENPQQPDWAERFQRAREMVDQAGRRELIEPLIAQALDTADPLRRMHIITVANLASLVERHAPRAHLAVTQALANPAELPDATVLRQHLALVRELGSLIARQK